MTDEHVVLSERPEDQLKAVEWAREQKKKILDDKSRRIADALMEKMTPSILKNSAQQLCNHINKIQNRIKMMRF